MRVERLTQSQSRDRKTMLEELAILDSSPEAAYDALTRLAALIMGVKRSVITVVDDHRAWFKSTYCFDKPEVPRERAICATAMLTTGATIILDTWTHPLWTDHPAANGEEPVRFYAGVPLVTAGGVTVGMLCAFDPLPRETVSNAQIEALADLGRMVVERIELRRQSRHLMQDRDSAEGFLKSVVENLPAMVFVKDSATKRYLLVNRQACELVGLSEGDIVGHTDEELFEHGRSYWIRDDAALRADGPILFESEYIPPGGSPISLRTRRIAIDGPDRAKQYVLGCSENVTEIRLAQAEAMRWANFDALTGLLNRRSFLQQMDDRIAAGQPFALLAIDLNKFKWVNDRFGHLVGDEVLTCVAERLRTVEGGEAVVGRIGGDEFAMIVATDHVTQVASTVVRRLSLPTVVTCGSVQTGASVGGARFPDDGVDTPALRHAADLAMYRAKAEKGEKVCFYSDALDVAAKDRYALEADLRDAIRDGMIRPVYQPVISVQSGRISSVEALARWQHPHRGFVPPGVFIPIAEEAGLIEALGTSIIRQACSDAVNWPAHVRVAVNVSPQQIHGGRLGRAIADALNESGLPASRLQVEVTEGMFLRDEQQTFEQLGALNVLGIQVLMDDFGVGYSSLSYFERFHFDKVKIDQSFIRNIVVSRPSQAIVAAVVSLSTSLGMAIIAEGVETEEQMQALISAGCTHLQGFYLAEPVSADQIGALAEYKYLGTS